MIKAQDIIQEIAMLEPLKNISKKLEYLRGREKKKTGKYEKVNLKPDFLLPGEFTIRF